MSKLLESTIQIKALQALKEHYSELHPQAEIFCEKELTTKNEFGRNRADGLICFENNNKPFTVSLEAKSHKTISALISGFNDERLGLQCLFLAGLITSMVSTGLTFTTNFHWYLILLVGLISFALSCYFTAKIFIKLNLSTHTVVGVINQIKKYPANEKWIAYSKYTGNLLLRTSSSDNLDYVKALEKKCKDNGIGLLLISNRGVEKRIYPKFVNGNFLHFYKREGEIKRFISKKTVPQF